MNKNNLLEISSAIFILLFIYTSTSKLFTIDTFKNVMTTVPYLSTYPMFFAICVISLEVVISLLLFFPAYRFMGFVATFILMLIFTVYIGGMLLFNTKLPCSCGGVIQKMSWNQHFIFNLILTILAIISVFLSRKQNINGNASNSKKIVLS